MFDDLARAIQSPYDRSVNERSVVAVDREATIPIVDETDVVIGTALRSEMRARNLLHRCTAVMVLNTAGDRLLVHQRSLDKAVWAGWWDIAAGGVVEVDEDLDEAAQRELQEELGVSAPLTKLGSGRHTDENVDAFMHVWVATHDGPFTFTDGEVQQVQWVSPADLAAQLNDPTISWCSDSEAVALRLLTEYFPVWQSQLYEP
jgi:isopentenyldiphosphate isomerase